MKKKQVIYHQCIISIMLIPLYMKAESTEITLVVLCSNAVVPSLPEGQIRLPVCEGLLVGKSSSRH